MKRFDFGFICLYKFCLRLHKNQFVSFPLSVIQIVFIHEPIQ